MKKLLTALVLFSIISISVNAQKEKKITLTVSKIKNDSTVIARRSYQYWKGECKTIPDQLKKGDKMVAVFSRTKDSCICFFKRYR